MGRMKDLLITVHGGGNEAVAAVSRLLDARAPEGDIVRNLRAAAYVLLECQEHVPLDGGRMLINLHKRADEMIAAADEIERLRGLAT